ncbi:DUF5050 domain-containing protein [Pedobacter sp. AW31-3R]|uniref:DUF5050 domain-containing protein n=1 Tax=Pedobacter sp. AW31-3R TaxID=3445781 RepID=UPI003F9EE1D2
MKNNLFKKALITTSILTLILFQTSCTKSDSPVTPLPEETVITPILIYRIINGNNPNSLWTIKADGTDKKQLTISLPSTMELAYEDLAEVSGDGKTLVFLAESTVTNNNSIYKCNIDGTNITKIFDIPGFTTGLQAVVNNNFVLYTQYPSSLELWSVNLDGSNNHKINIALPAGISLEEEELAKVTTDGNTIIFIGTNISSGANIIYKCNLDGSGVTAVATETPEYTLRLQSLSPENAIIYGKEGSTTNELWSVKPDGSNKHQISLSLPAGTVLQSEEMANAKADVLFFAVYKTLTGTEAIYTAKTDGSNVKLLTEESAGKEIALQATY